ncbi:MAG TPA: hypothetical protein VL860_04035, partial [Planctomycetota bacterium]|nr:hypothetical protein [Planctomycetota bacterium]
MIEMKRGVGGISLLRAALLGATLLALPGEMPNLRAAVVPAAAEVTAPAPLFQEDTLDAPEVYERRLMQLAADQRGANSATVMELQFNAAMAWRSANRPRRALPYWQALMKQRPGDFSL